MYSKDESDPGQLLSPGLYTFIQLIIYYYFAFHMQAVEMQHLEIAQILVKANKAAVSIFDYKGKRASDAIPSYNQTIWQSILSCNNSE